MPRVRLLSGSLLLAAVAGCGGNVAVWSANADAGSAGAAPTTDAGDSGGETAVAAPTTRERCEARGGTCTHVDHVVAACPTGYVDAFSGADALCSESPPERCCVPAGQVGTPCSPEDDCQGFTCLLSYPEQSNRGQCSMPCVPGENECPVGAVCLPGLSLASDMCLISCRATDECPVGSTCEAFPAELTDRPVAKYACWVGWNTPSSGSAPWLLGDPACSGSGLSDGCVSRHCAVDPRDGNARCSAACDDTHPCLDGFVCLPDGPCMGAGCGDCFPTSPSSDSWQ